MYQNLTSISGPRIARFLYGFPIGIKTLLVLLLCTSLQADGITLTDWSVPHHNRDLPLLSEVPLKLKQDKVEIVVTGRVTDTEGKPIPGAGVKVKGQTTGVQTDIDGNFKITVPNEETILIFSFVGFETIEKKVDGKNFLTIALQDESQNLNQVVVIGYGTTKRSNFTGSVTSLKVENSPLAQQPNTNALQALQGSVPGLSVGATVDAGGQPSIQIRGQNSIRGNNAPLIVVDGVIFLGDLGNINPNDIASYDILKDAVASAAYGSRSANGVIAITLKKGRGTQPTITFNTSTAVQTWQRKPKLFDAADWINLVNAANSYVPGSTYWLKPQEVANMKAGIETDWLNLVTRNGALNTAQVAVSGNGAGINYYVSGAYDNNKGIVENDNFDRINILGKMSMNVTKWLQIGLDGDYAKRDYSGITPDIRVAQRMTPYGQVYRDDFGNLEKYPAEQGAGFVNPLWGINDGLRDNSDIRNSFRLNTFALLTAPWIKGLTYRFNFSNNLVTRKNGDFTHEGFYVAEGAVTNTARYAPATIQNFLVQANGQIDNYNTSSYVMDHILNYNQTFDKHRIDLTAVATRDETKYRLESINGTNYAANGNTALGFDGLTFATTPKITLTATQTANVGYLGRLSYAYDERYLFDAVFRRDGASVFGLERKWGNFKALGLSWIATKEPFLKDIKGLDMLKLKLTWGQNGNQGVGAYSTLARVNLGASSGVRYEFFNTGSTINYGLTQVNLANADLGWEATEKWNTGFESALLGNRLFVDLDLYASTTTDIIYTPTIPSPTGFTSITSSLGEVHNKGVEFRIQSLNFKDTPVKWNTSIIFSLNRNKLVHIDGRDLDGDGLEDNRIADGMFIGQPLNSIYGYLQDGIVQPSDTKYKAMPGAATIDGYPKYVDINGDGQITAADRTILGYPQERFRLSMSNTVSYKGFELYVMFTGIVGGGGYYQKANPQAFITSSGTEFNSNSPYIPYWTTENQSNVYPAAFFKSDGKFLGLQSRTFIRVQNISLSYSLPQSVLTKLKISSFKIFANANSPFVSTKWFGGDPEVGTPAIDGTKPVASTYSLGISTSF